MHKPARCAPPLLRRPACPPPPLPPGAFNTLPADFVTTIGLHPYHTSGVACVRSIGRNHAVVAVPGPLPAGASPSASDLLGSVGAGSDGAGSAIAIAYGGDGDTCGAGRRRWQRALGRAHGATQGQGRRQNHQSAHAGREATPAEHQLSRHQPLRRAHPRLQLVVSRSAREARLCMDKSLPATIHVATAPCLFPVQVRVSARRGHRRRGGGNHFSTVHRPGCNL